MKDLSLINKKTPRLWGCTRFSLRPFPYPSRGLGLYGGQVFRLPDLPTPRTFPGPEAPVAYCGFRPRSRRRDRGGFSPHFPFKPTMGTHLYFIFPLNEFMVNSVVFLIESFSSWDFWLNLTSEGKESS